MDYSTINTLAEISFIAGTTQVLEFNAVDETTILPVDLGAATCSWHLAHFSNPTETVLSKNGIVSGVDNETFTITLETEDTEELEGKFIQQPIVVDFVGKEYRLEQGIVYIRPRA